jgi:hypothetical protein
MNPLQAAKNEINELLKKKAEIERRFEADQAEINRRLKAVQQTIKILEPVYANDPWVNALAFAAYDGGLTDRVRDLLRASFPGAATPVAIRDAILASGFDASKRSNFLSEIHSVLRRLDSQDEVEPIDAPEGKKFRAKSGLNALAVSEADIHSVIGQRSKAPPRPPVREYIPPRRIPEKKK